MTTGMARGLTLAELSDQERMSQACSHTQLIRQ